MQSILYSWQPQDGRSYETIKTTEVIPPVSPFVSTHHRTPSSQHEVYPKVPPSTLRKWKQRSASRPGYIPRPPNSFVFFRCDFVRRNAGTGGDLSRRAAAAWKHLPEDVKAQYKQRAADAAAEHRQLFPNYVYKPEPRTSAHSRAPRSNGTEGHPCDVTSVAPSLGSSSNSPSNSPFLALHHRSISEPLIVNPERCLPSSPYDCHRLSRTECYSQPETNQGDGLVWFDGEDIASPIGQSNNVYWPTPAYNTPSKPCFPPYLHQRSISESLINDHRQFLPSLNDHYTNSRTECHLQPATNIEHPLWAGRQNPGPSFASAEQPGNGVDWQWDASAFPVGLSQANEFGVQPFGPVACELQVDPFTAAAAITPSNEQFRHPEWTEGTSWCADTHHSWA
jgi:hypothetical protein